MALKGNLYIGTSGWVYPSWEGIFYPETLKHQDKLRYFSQQFKTTEVNYSFYHLPRPSTYKKWYFQTPSNFVFAVKASRFITHIKRLKEVQNAWKIFLENALCLKEKLGPILFQFPPSFKATAENVSRLDNFLENIHMRNKKTMAMLLRIGVEFRHKSWCNEKIYSLLRKHNVAWVIADSSRYPKVEMITADFTYIRMHGPAALFASKYPDSELKKLSQEIRNWRKSNISVYCYFNNDFSGYAVENAKTLVKFCS